MSIEEKIQKLVEDIENVLKEADESEDYHVACVAEQLIIQAMIFGSSNYYEAFGILKSVSDEYKDKINYDKESHF